MDKLPAHLDHHREVFAQCAEIIHCDSESTDGTRQHVQNALIHPCLRQVDHPPGLYESWNFAIQQCTQAFIYISTVGDQIDLAGLRQLFDLAIKTQADVVISPPRYLEESGRVNNHILWPIDRLIQSHSVKEPALVPNELIFSEAVLHAPDGILGSSASCLFRAAFLKPRPFPLGFRGACDSAWAFENLPYARCAIIPTPLSTFLLHPKTYESHGLVNAQIAVLIREHLQKLLPQLIEKQSSVKIAPTLLYELLRFNQIAMKLAYDDNQLIILYKRLRALWPLFPSVWLARARRNRQRKLTRQIASVIRQKLSEPVSA